ncbi:MAG: hypothetical protein L6R40_008359 [Gallowayella cf. fulva]|nr:MAG: hypothetical protein L6R40_008359 [Xanthomendoza cf. fulva]
MDTLTTVTAAVNDQTIPAQVDLASMSNSMAHTFFWKHDDKIDQKCQMLAGIVKAAIVAAFIVLGTIVAPAAAPATAGVGAALGETGAVAAIFGNTAARSSPWTMAALSNGARAWVKSTRQNSVLEKGVGIASNFPPNVGGDALERAICKNFPNAPKGNEEEAQRQIDKLIATNAENYREFIQSTNAEIMEGAGFGINGGILPLDTTVLAEVLQFGEYLKLTPEQHHRIVGEPHELEGEIKSYFQNAVVSVILESQMCYILCSGTKSKKPDRTSFEPEPGRFCEAKCWRNWKGAKTLELFGLDKLVQEHNDWDITVQDFLRASYDHYKNHGLGRGPMLPSVANGIPCMCGDKYGSETAAFWDVANFASWSAARSDSAQVTTHDSPEYLCGRRMAHEKILPVPYFFNLCRMGVHWPNKYERPRWRNGDNAHLIRGQDVSCEAFEGTVDVWHKGQSIGMMQGPEDPLDENCYMCYYSPIGQSIRKEQEKDGFGWKPYYPDLIDDESAFYNFDKACQKMRHDRKFPGGDIRRCRSPNYPDPEGDIGI